MAHVGAGAVLFDLDGTLIDSIELIELSYRHALAAQSSRVFDRDEWLVGLGRPLRWQFEQWSDDPTPVQRMIVTYREYNNAHHDRMVKPCDGALEAVDALHRRGVRLGIVTSKMRAGALRGLICAGFAGFFMVVIGCDDVREPKPAAGPALPALSRLDHGARAGRRALRRLLLHRDRGHRRADSQQATRASACRTLTAVARREGGDDRVHEPRRANYARYEAPPGKGSGAPQDVRRSAQGIPPI